MSIQCCVGALVSATRDNKTTIVCGKKRQKHVHGTFENGVSLPF